MQDDLVLRQLLLHFAHGAEAPVLEAPPWAYIACACGLFIYQSLDAIDGKQARRTNSSTPLGELFDHGCDSLSTVFVVLGTCIAVQLGTNPDWMFFCCFAGTFMFYCAHWQTYVSGTLRFGIIDVTEVQIFIIIMHLLAVIGGPPFWQSLIPILNIQVKIFPALCTVAGTIFSCTNYFGVIFTGGVGKNGSTIAVKYFPFTSFPGLGKSPKLILCCVCVRRADLGVRGLKWVIGSSASILILGV
ncbi:LOW QUALITY PROTEIN: choline/ethanolaminephosphotransferase 1 [Manacus vitellinus]|uniref:LOW QUALITY PROTEIN: choline/ethanolaminephosphotransferase 1 n=1 Tax=Manacus vitellinus TaxID=328815 RepID=UPI00115E565B|nr:LOW QUALITY PROTEIN: choline/ethanolaminephosphotransferase 1 [Manacus vitellinus]